MKGILLNGGKWVRGEVRFHKWIKKIPKLLDNLTSMAIIWLLQKNHKHLEGIDSHFENLFDKYYVGYKLRYKIYHFKYHLVKYLMEIT